MPSGEHPPPIVSLLTDFGCRDAYVGIMKAVLLARCRHAHLVDVSHEVPAQQVVPGALLLRSAATYFPVGTVHLAVVDPGVGTSRRPIVVETDSALFVGPDNGLLLPAARSLGAVSVRRIDNPDLVSTSASNTFHGRDIFAPVAGSLAAGSDVRDVGPEITDPVELDLPVAEIVANRIEGRILYVDGFGNAITNISEALVSDAVSGDCVVHVGGLELQGLHAAYGSVAVGTAVALVSSWGTVEIAVNGGNAARTLDLNVGDAVAIEVE